MTEHFFTIMMAIIIGVIGGFGAVIIRFLVEAISEFFFSGHGSILERISVTPWYFLLLIPTFGGLLVGLISKYSIADAKGHGVPEVMTAILQRGGVINPLVAVFKAVTTSITIGTGGSVGNEGPMVQIGASLGSGIGQFFKVNARRMKILVGCGVAAGIAGAFNVPVAGALFAIEVVLLDFAVGSFTPIIVSSSIATVITHYFVGDFTEFTVQPLMLVSPLETISFFILGALAGLTSFLFIKTLYSFEAFSEKYVKVSPIIKPALGGLMIGIIGIMFPQIMGIGNDSINLTINNPMIWYLALILVFVKMVATSVTLSSGGSGGVLSPALFMGAMLGSFYGSIVHYYFPEQTASPNAYALVAMGGLIAGIVRAPLTAIIIVFELTKQTSAILPLMLVSTISLILSQKLSRESIYTLRLVMKKIKYERINETNLLKSLVVRDVISNDYTSVSENTTFTEIVKLIVHQNLQCISVYSVSDKSFMGLISLDAIKGVMFDKELIDNLVIAGDIADRNIAILDINDNCMNALKLINNSKYLGLPVLDPDTKIQIGFVWLDDINDYHQRESEMIESASNFAEKIMRANHKNDANFIEGHLISEFEVPQKFVGRSIIGLKIRNKYKVEIISIKHKNENGDYEQLIPHPDYIFHESDLIMVTGEIEKVNILKNL